MNLKVNIDGTYDFHFRGEDLATVVKLVKQNEIWRDEERFKESEKARLKIEEAERVLTEESESQRQERIVRESERDGREGY